MNINESLLNKLKAIRALNEADGSNFSFNTFTEDIDDDFEPFDTPSFGEGEVAIGKDFDEGGESYTWDKSYSNVVSTKDSNLQLWSAENRITDDIVYFIVDPDTSKIQFGPFVELEDVQNKLDSLVPGDNKLDTDTTEEVSEVEPADNIEKHNKNIAEDLQIMIHGVEQLPENGLEIIPDQQPAAPVIEVPAEEAPLVNPVDSQLGCVVDTATKVMEAYQNANKWMDILKEFLFTDMGCPFFSSYIHNLAHTMPVRFDKFGDILHTIDMKIPYPATQYIPQEPSGIDDVFNLTFMILDAIKTALNDFIKCTDENYHGMSCAAETLLNDIEAEYVPLYKMRKAWTEYQEPMRFDRWVGTYAEKRADLNESLNEAHAQGNTGLVFFIDKSGSTARKEIQNTMCTKMEMLANGRDYSVYYFGEYVDADPDSRVLGIGTNFGQVAKTINEVCNANSEVVIFTDSDFYMNDSENDLLDSLNIKVKSLTVYDINALAKPLWSSKDHDHTRNESSNEARPDTKFPKLRFNGPRNELTLAGKILNILSKEHSLKSETLAKMLKLGLEDLPISTIQQFKDLGFITYNDGICTITDKGQEFVDNSSLFVGESLTESEDLNELFGIGTKYVLLFPDSKDYHKHLYNSLKKAKTDAETIIKNNSFDSARTDLFVRQINIYQLDPEWATIIEEDIHKEKNSSSIFSEIKQYGKLVDTVEASKNAKASNEFDKNWNKKQYGKEYRLSNESLTESAFTFNNFEDWYDHYSKIWNDCEESKDLLEIAFNTGLHDKNWDDLFDEYKEEVESMTYMECAFDAGRALAEGKNTYEEALNEANDQHNKFPQEYIEKITEVFNRNQGVSEDPSNKILNTWFENYYGDNYNCYIVECDDSNAFYLGQLWSDLNDLADSCNFGYEHMGNNNGFYGKTYIFYEFQAEAEEPEEAPIEEYLTEAEENTKGLNHILAKIKKDVPDFKSFSVENKSFGGYRLINLYDKNGRGIGQYEIDLDSECCKPVVKESLTEAVDDLKLFYIAYTDNNGSDAAYIIKAEDRIAARLAFDNYHLGQIDDIFEISSEELADMQEPIEAGFVTLDANVDSSLTEDTVKQGKVWVNKGDEGTHGEFDTKKEADDQRKAMFANGYTG